MGKDMIKNELMHRMKYDKCPICGLVEKRSESRIESVLKGAVTDTDTRREFLDSEGFCKHHAERVLRRKQPLSHAILYGNLLEYKMRRIGREKFRKAKCRFCELEDESEKIYVYWFAKSLTEEAFFETYKEQAILCTTHLDAVLRKLRKKHPMRETLIETTKEKYDALNRDLQEIRRKYNYKYAKEAWTNSEKEAWKKVVRLLIDQGEHRR